MFIGREKELRLLESQFNSSERTAVLVYGKRRIGKSTLIAEAAKSYGGIVIEHLCIQSTLQGNMEMLCRSVSRALGLPRLQFEHIYDVFDFLAAQDREMLIVLDEYQYLKQAARGNEMDSYMQAIIDSLPANIKLVLCGSYISIMKELVDEANPLFGRFTAIVHLREFDYLDASLFYPEASPYEKVAFYALFGGSPFVLSTLDPSASPQMNLEQLLLPETGILRTHIENVMLKEVQKSFDIRILEIIGNGKKRYSEIQGKLGGPNNGLLDKQLKSLMEMETVKKSYPINKGSDKKKQFYEIEDNLMRAYFAFLFGNTALVSRLGEQMFFEREVAPTCTQFISRRFEEVVQQYFSRLARAGRIAGVEDFGSYWFDDSATRTNGEFDCVMARDGKLDFYECKYRTKPMGLGECRAEEQQVRAIPDVEVGTVGFACTGGFDFESDEYALVAGDDLYNGDLL